jgi:hypothetical protein
MTLLQRVLRAQAIVWTVCGLAVIGVPRWVLVTLFGQVPYPDYTYVRVSGAMAIGFSLLAVLVSRRLDDLWWWTWSLAITDAVLATITAIDALVIMASDGSRAGVAFWWLFAALNAALATGLLLGLGRAGQEKPFT